MHTQDPSLHRIPQEAPSFAAGTYEAYRSIGGETVQENEAIIHRVLEEYAMDHRVTVVPVGESGFAILGFPEYSGSNGDVDRAEKHPAKWAPSVAGTEPVLLEDLDDALIDYSGAKLRRDDRFYDAVRAHVGSDEEAARIADGLMAATDDFARWSEQGKKEQYHDLAHQLAIGRALQQLAAGVAAEDIRLELKRIASRDHVDGAPFRFDGGRLLCDEPEVLVSAEVQDIFSPMLRPEIFPDAAEAALKLQHDGVHQSIFTRGGYDFQTRKTLEAFYYFGRARRDLAGPQGKGWPFQHVLVTTDSKGTFMRDLYELSKTDPRIREAFFSDQPHAVLHFDDSESELASMRRTEGLLAESGARLVTVPTLRKETKNASGWSGGPTARAKVGAMAEHGHAKPYIDPDHPALHSGTVSSVLSGAIAEAFGDGYPHADDTSPAAQSIRAQIEYFTRWADMVPGGDGREQLWIADQQVGGWVGSLALVTERLSRLFRRGL